MTKREWAFLAVGIIVVVIIIVAIFAVRSCRQTPLATPPPNDDSTLTAPTTTPVKPRITPTVAPPAKLTATSHVSVSINAVPWAEVFIKLPGTNRFRKPGVKYFKIAPEPNGTDTHVTPIRGKMKVPAGTAIKLVYEGREKIFPYDSWKTRHSISHDFLGQ